MQKSSQGIRLPLSSAQRGIWLAQELLGNEASNNIAELITIHGPVDEEKLRSAVRQYLLEVESLRARVEQADGDIFQRIAPDADFYMGTIDVSGDPDPIVAIKAWVASDLGRGLSQPGGRLYETALFKISPQSYAWYLRTHHVTCDGYSGMLIARRVAELYTANTEGHSPSESQFGPVRDLVEDDVAYRSSPQFVRDREFWAREMAQPPHAVTLAARYKSKSTQFMREVIHLGSGVENKLTQLEPRTSNNLANVMFALVAAYLHRMTGAEDLVIGLPVAARMGQISRLVPGMVANVVPLRLKVDAEADIGDLVRQAGRSLRPALRHQRYRAEDLRQDLSMLASGEPLFNVLADYSAFDYKLNFGGYPARVENLSNGTVEDLNFEFYDLRDGSGLRIEINFNQGLYSAEEAHAHRGHFERLLEAVLADPGRKVGEIEILKAEERAQLLYGWNETAHPIPDGTVVELFELQAEKSADAVAVEYEESSLSYAELNRRANQLAHMLREQGVGPEGIVGICMERSLEMLVSLLGVLKAGGAYLPLDPGYPRARLEFMLEDARPVCVLTAGAAGEILPGDRLLLRLDEAETLSLLAGHSKANPDRGAIGLILQHPAYVIYTSGSTGIPKGVLIEHRALLNYITWAKDIYLTGQGRGSLVSTALTFDATVTSLFLPLLSGTAVTLPREELGVKELVHLRDGGEPFGLLKVTPAHVDLFSQILPMKSLSGLAHCLVKLSVGSRLLKRLLPNGGNTLP
jgi:nonribosomal peptide synthetase DhbF